MHQNIAISFRCTALRSCTLCTRHSLTLCYVELLPSRRPASVVDRCFAALKMPLRIDWMAVKTTTESIRVCVCLITLWVHACICACVCVSIYLSISLASFCGNCSDLVLLRFCFDCRLVLAWAFTSLNAIRFFPATIPTSMLIALAATACFSHSRTYLTVILYHTTYSM